MPILDVRNLSVAIPTEDGTIHALRNVSFSVEPGEVFGIAGESGSGKSVLTQVILGLLPKATVTGEILFGGRDLLRMTAEELRQIRGSKIGMIFQDPMSSLHPYYSIGRQITETVRAHERTSHDEARRRAVALLDRVGISRAAERFDMYPHEFSGGMRQRVMIAMALVLSPPLVIADEPTTALDVTVQAQIIELLDEMRRERGTTIMMITHDLGLLSSIAEHVMVMYAGQRMELGPGRALFAAPAHPYTSGLLASSPGNYEPGAELVPIPGRPPSLLESPKGCVFAPRCARVLPRCAAEAPPVRKYSDKLESACWLEQQAPAPQATLAARAPSSGSSEIVVSAKDVRLTYGGAGPFRKGRGVEVLKGIDLELHRGETLGLVGESGCGKSTFARVLAGLVRMTSGSISLMGRDVGQLDRQSWRAMRREVQLVFQNPYGALNPRRRIGAIIGDPFRLHGLASGRERKKEVQRLMELVGLNPEHYNRFPSEFSGGQRQRIGIARALALNPALVVYDEPVSALDVSIQAQVLNLISQLQRDLGLTYLFISHDLGVVRHVCDRIAVMQGGQIVELADAEQLYASPQHECTRALLAAMHPSPVRAAQPDRVLVDTIPAVVQ